MRALAALALVPLVSAAAPQEDYVEPYRILQQANLSLDPSLAASAYASDGALIFEYPGQPREEFRGRESIRASYVRTFGQVEPGRPIELKFRFEPPGPSPRPQAPLRRLSRQGQGGWPGHHGPRPLYGGAGQAAWTLAFRRRSRGASRCGRL